MKIVTLSILALAMVSPKMWAKELKPVTVQNDGLGITLNEIHLWRDWQPMVARPGKDGGSPLKVVATYTIVSAKTSAQKIHWRASLSARKGAQKYPLEMWEADSENPWGGNLKALETRKVRLRTSSGPYVKAGDMFVLEVTFNGDGEELMSTSQPVKVEATH